MPHVRVRLKYIVMMHYSVSTRSVVLQHVYMVMTRVNTIVVRVCVRNEKIIILFKWD